MVVIKVLSRMSSVRRCHDGKKQKCNSNSKNKLMKTLLKTIERGKILRRMRIIKRNLATLKNKLKLLSWDP
jgi:hypothetical protein